MRIIVKLLMMVATMLTMNIMMMFVFPFGRRQNYPSRAPRAPRLYALTPIASAAVHDWQQRCPDRCPLPSMTGSSPS